jgi:predicted metal-binding membrane protein
MNVVSATRRHPGAAAGLLAAAALAWWLTVQRMAGMDASPGTDLGALGWFATTWLVMMAAMMLPSFVPTLAAYETATGKRAPSSVLFAAGYLLAWVLAGLVAYGLFKLGKALFASELAWHQGGRWVSASVIFVAAVYEFVPVKRMCLARCRGDLGALHRASSPSWLGAVEPGFRSGGWCIGCSWALMVALFALGVMSLTWMVVIAALVACEKLGPWPTAGRLATAAVLAALAVGILVAPDSVPGLVVPHAEAMHSMTMM